MARRRIARGSFAVPEASAARSKPPRLKLDELEPRIAPSSLLYNLPLVDAMVDGSWFMADGNDGSTINHQPS
ncbi:MAG: hypothetical protein FJ272_19600, partial [Planctomycetes bacterium]|nr:hypothetical protein [Planctomycetota bacterium]